MEANRLVLLDGHAILFRAYHAMPAFTTPDGRPSGAVYGFTNLVLRILRELEPAWVVVCFDAPGPTFRDAQYPAYKAKRPEVPTDLIAQEPMVREVLDALAIPHLARSGFEADDLIGTLTRQAGEQAVPEVVIVTGDRDLLQLSRNGISIYLLRNGAKTIELLDVSAVTELIGLPPSQLLEWKALRGDPSDNIIGVPGVGDKTALNLIQTYGTLEKLFEALEAGTLQRVAPRIGQTLLEYKERAFANRRLLTIEDHSPVKLDLAGAARSGYRRAATAALLTSFGFKSIVARLPEDASSRQSHLF